ncbi:TraB/GumN family protein [Foetidibacter luteolus]|uniref:TraB/GumN family protein n=1 Tax=Foetidibacter luteolus TaxID=2608880 RepID=UPI00129B0A47|nr:TraB/GumN family protein [Foetidibacter luteolus]
MKIILGVLTVFMVITGATAQKAADKTLLWEVSGNGLVAPSYLYGTFHLICPADLQESPVIDEKLKGAKKLYLEMDMDDPAVIMKVQQGMMLTDTSWKSLLTEDEYKSFSENFKKMTGISADMVTKIKPFGLVSLVLMRLMECQPASWDMTLAKKANDNKIEVKGLETPERELEAINSLSLKDQTEMLKEMLDNPDSTKQSLQAMVAIYKSKNIDSMQSIMTSDKRFGFIESELLVKRNKEWIPEIEKQAALEPTFFAFGAGHLGGENGVLNLLKKKGYKIKPVLY